jgi:8-oxo-dGTP diphosphatase
MAGADIAVAVVTQGGRVLLIRRAVAEGSLGWAFLAGKRQAGESVAAAAVREAAEETGVEVAATLALGGRVHPETGTHLTYIACTMVGGTAWAASPREVAKVRWASPQEADELTGGTIFEPVRRYLRCPTVPGQGIQ